MRESVPGLLSPGSYCTVYEEYKVKVDEEKHQLKNDPSFVRKTKDTILRHMRALRDKTFSAASDQQKCANTILNDVKDGRVSVSTLTGFEKGYCYNRRVLMKDEHEFYNLLSVTTIRDRIRMLSLEIIQDSITEQWKPLVFCTNFQSINDLLRDEKIKQEMAQVEEIAQKLIVKKKSNADPSVEIVSRDGLTMASIPKSSIKHEGQQHLKKKIKRRAAVDEDEDDNNSVDSERAIKEEVTTKRKYTKKIQPKAGETTTNLESKLSSLLNILTPDQLNLLLNLQLPSSSSNSVISLDSAAQTAITVPNTLSSTTPTSTTAPAALTQAPTTSQQAPVTVTATTISTTIPTSTTAPTALTQAPTTSQQAPVTVTATTISTTIPTPIIAPASTTSSILTSLPNRVATWKRKLDDNDDCSEGNFLSIQRERSKSRRSIPEWICTCGCNQVSTSVGVKCPSSHCNNQLMTKCSYGDMIKCNYCNNTSRQKLEIRK